MCKILNCYHGTSKENAEKILSMRIYKESGSEEWLGRGVYFFENDPSQAHKFVKAYKRLSDESIEVLETDLRITENDVMLDLLTDEDRDFIEQYEKKIQNRLSEKAASGNMYWNHREAYVLDFLFEKSPYALVKAAYKIPKKESKEGFGYHPVHIQVCVKQACCIMKDTIKIYEGVRENAFEKI